MGQKLEEFPGKGNRGRPYKDGETALKTEIDEAVVEGRPREEGGERGAGPDKIFSCLQARFFYRLLPTKYLF